MPRKKTRRRANHEGSVYQRKDGRFVAAVSVKGKRLVAYAATKDAAKEKLAKLHKKAKAPRVANSPKTVDECVRGHIDRMDVEDSTKEWKRDQYNLHCSPTLGYRPIQDLEPQEVVEWLAGMVKADTGPRALQVAFDVLRSALEEAVRPLRLLDEDPTAGIPRPKAEPAECEPFTPDEATMILNAKRGDRNELIYWLAFVCGMRQGEIFGLKKSDVDLQAEEFQIRRQVVEYKGKQVVRDKPKTKAGYRRIAMPPIVVALVRKRIDDAEAEGLGECEWLCPTMSGQPWRRSNWSTRHWRPLLVDLRELHPRMFEHRGFHHARHSAASIMLQSRISAHIVSKVIGHAKTSTTMDIYGHLLPGDATGALSVIAGRISPAVTLLSDVQGSEQPGEGKTKSG